MFLDMRRKYMIYLMKTNFFKAALAAIFCFFYLFAASATEIKPAGMSAADRVAAQTLSINTAQQIKANYRQTSDEKSAQPVLQILFFTSKDCPFCKLARTNYWRHLAALRSGVRLVGLEIHIDQNLPLLLADGTVITHKAFARQLAIRATPTVMLVDNHGQLLSQTLVGIGAGDFYAFNLDELVDAGVRALK
jgi:thioredoxin-related protein